MPLEKIQVVVRHSSPFDRRRGTATLLVDTAATDLTHPTLTLPYLEAGGRRRARRPAGRRNRAPLLPLVAQPHPSPRSSPCPSSPLLLLPAACSCSAGAAAPAADDALPQGFAFGDVKADSAVFWTRLPSGHGRLELREGGAAFPHRRRSRPRAEDDFTTHVELAGLAANRRYGLRLAALDGAGKELAVREGELRTAPGPSDRPDLAFVMSGDLGGQGCCRHPEKGYAIFQAMAALEPDFFIANGDLIYADSVCPPKNPDGQPNLESSYLDVSRQSARLARRRQDLRGVRRPLALQPCRPPLPAIPVAHRDLHPVGRPRGDQRLRRPLERMAARSRPAPATPTWSPRAAGRFSSTTRSARHPDEPKRIYRSFSWGPELELFLVDARSYRSDNDAADRPANAKTALGKTQVEWLKESLRKSPATFKVISNDVPLALPTGSQSQLYGRDAFANGTSGDFAQRTGFESELVDLLTFLDRENIDNVVFLATDVHFAMELRYAIDLDGDGDLLHFHELIAGPLSAVRTVTPFPLDPTFKPVTLFAQGDIFNFLFVRLEHGEGGVPTFRQRSGTRQGRFWRDRASPSHRRLRDKG